MTDKRFTIPKGYRVIKDNVTDECATFYDNDDGETFLKWLNDLQQEAKDNEHYHSEVLRLYKVVSEENEQLKSQLLYDGDSVCNICKHQYLVENGKYYVAKCEKEHEECSKVDLRYCEDFELVRDYE